MIELITSNPLINTFIGVVIGFLVSFLFYKLSKVKKSMAYYANSYLLLSKEGGKLPTSKITVFYESKEINNLCKSIIFIWNDGNMTIFGKDIALGDELKIVFSNGNKILETEVARITNIANNFIINVVNDVINFKFDFLEPGDGALIETTYTGKYCRPKIVGTIIGMPKGVNRREYRKFEKNIIIFNRKVPLLLLTLIAFVIISMVFISFVNNYIVAMICLGIVMSLTLLISLFYQKILRKIPNIPDKLLK